MLTLTLPGESEPRQTELAPIIDACKRAEAKHKLTHVDGKVQPTGKFLATLAAELSKALGVPTLPKYAAWQVWITAFALYEQLATKHATDAELAFWYKINPFTLTDEQKLALSANLARVKAQDRMHRGDYDPGDYKGVYNLVLLATGDETQAVQARANAMEVYEARATRTKSRSK